MFTFNSSLHNPLRRGLALAVLLLVLLSGLVFAQPSYADDSSAEDESQPVEVSITNVTVKESDLVVAMRWGRGNLPQNAFLDVTDAEGEIVSAEFRAELGEQTVVVPNGLAENRDKKDESPTKRNLEIVSGDDGETLVAIGIEVTERGVQIVKSWPWSLSCAPTNYIDGTPENDFLPGSQKTDVINGFAGNDTIRGFGCRDDLRGFDGDDKIFGGDGNDFIFGHAGNDILRGNKGKDTLIGNGGDDRIYGGRGNDTINGAGGDDIIKGGKGNDTIDGFNGDDIIYGGPGDDFIDGGDGFDLCYGGGGNDTIINCEEQSPDLIISASVDESCQLTMTITNIGSEGVEIGEGNVWSVDSIMFNGELTEMVSGGPNAFLEADGGSITVDAPSSWDSYSNPLTLTVIPVSEESNVDNNTTVIDVPAECQGNPDLIISASVDESCQLTMTITNIGSQGVEIGEGNVWSVDSIMFNGELTEMVSGGPNGFLEADGGSVTVDAPSSWDSYSNPLTLTVIPVSEESNVDNNTTVIDVPAECQACIGDVDFDGNVDADDIELIREHILGISQLPPEAQDVADANGDGQISTFDLVLIMRQPCFQ